MNTITCGRCGETIEIDKALEGQIEARVLDAERARHSSELESARKQAEASAAERLKGQLELQARKNEQALELERERISVELSGNARKKELEQERLVQRLKDAAAAEKEAGSELREQLKEMMESLREEKKARANAELEARRKLAEDEEKIRDEAVKSADERHRLNEAASRKTITDLQKALDEAQRKAAQGSQQLQGEVMELDLEATLRDAFRDDDVQPVPKGERGGDIRHAVRGPRGTEYGVMIWEIKRTKGWTDGWIPKLKEDLRAGKANIPIIVAEAMPKQVAEDIGYVQGVWVCKPHLAVILATLLRKGLVDAGQQKAMAENRGTKADALYGFVTGHEFIQQVEGMVETFGEMSAQIARERVAYEKLWAQREKQAQRLFIGTANIVGSIQGHVGQSAMPRIKGIDLVLESGDDEGLEGS